MNTKKKVQFKVGDLVRITADSFGDSDEESDVKARGAIGVLTDVCLEPEINGGVTCWYWCGLDGNETCPIETEMEHVKPATITRKMVRQEAKSLRGYWRGSDDPLMAMFLHRVESVLAQEDA